MTGDEDRDKAIQALMKEQRLSERLARFVYSVESGEIPGDVVYRREGEIVPGRPAIPLRTEKR